MLILLPPSETKRDGGDVDRRLALDALSYRELTPVRRATIARLRAVSRTISGGLTALKLSAGQRVEVDRNRALGSSATMAAVDRYTGVLYDALDSASLSSEARSLAGEAVVIHSALFGFVGALDPIPAYRLSHDSRLPGSSLASVWREPLAHILDQTSGLVLDLRSESYSSMGPLASGADRWFVRVVARGEDGVGRALNHFNKKGKGQFVRRILEAGIDHANTDSLLAWAAASEIDLEFGDRPGELNLAVANTVAGSAR
ncbi:YaaA family protein [Marisediminicola sp. LYQ134]|uniref:YaaA family protein n=1 Tax=unclassified Marisediminicola TaxID=2618316 RepID=UPI003983BD7D